MAAICNILTIQSDCNISFCPEKVATLYNLLIAHASGLPNLMTFWSLYPFYTDVNEDKHRGHLVGSLTYSAAHIKKIKNMTIRPRGLAFGSICWTNGPL